MKKTLSFLKLDFMTVKPYFTLKNLLLLLVVSAAVIFSTRNTGVVFGIVTMYGLVFASYPFAVGEKNHLDLLYATLFVSRRHIVVGRYLFALCLHLLAATIAYVLAFAVSYGFGKGFDALEALAAMGGCLLVFLCIQAIQLPLYFKLGYQKAKFAAYLPLVGFPAVIAGISYIGRTPKTDQVWMGMIAWITQHLTLAAVLAGIFCLLLFGLSCALSCRMYQKRNF